MSLCIQLCSHALVVLDPCSDRVGLLLGSKEGTKRLITPLVYGATYSQGSRSVAARRTEETVRICNSWLKRPV